MNRDVAKEIEACGGAAAVADAVGQKRGTVRQWCHRGIIPRAAWPELMEHFPETFTLERLKALEVPSPAEAGDQAA